MRNVFGVINVYNQSALQGSMVINITIGSIEAPTKNCWIENELKNKREKPEGAYKTVMVIELK